MFQLYFLLVRLHLELSAWDLILIVVVAYLSDRLKLRGPLILICVPLTIIGKRLHILDISSDVQRQV